MAMYVELIMKPIKERDGKMLMWFDNCGCHKTDGVKDLLQLFELDTALLPPNMTDILQVLDLIVNGPVKRNTRTLRAMRIMEYFKNYKHELAANMERPQEQRVKMGFRPPKPTTQQSIQDLIDLMANDFATPSFKDSIKKSFPQCWHDPRRKRFLGRVSTRAHDGADEN